MAVSLQRTLSAGLSIKNQHNPTDFISVAEVQQQIQLHTGRTVSCSTVARWVAKNSLDHELPIYKGQWIVGGVLFEEFLLESRN